MKYRLRKRLYKEEYILFILCVFTFILTLVYSSDKNSYARNTKE